MRHLLAHLAKLKRQSPALFDATAQALTATTQEPIGQPGVSEVSGTTSAADILAKAGDAGVAYGKGLTAWVSKNHPNEFDAVMALARK